MNSSLNSRFTEVQICAKSDTNGGIKQKHNVSTRILDQLSGLSDDVLDPLSAFTWAPRSKASILWFKCLHGDRCMLARAGAGQSDMTASTEYSVGHSVWM
ncbi:hypothetical protein E4U47_006916 [Claviceps purpurea]|nr:hypothetical protein E4U47_006916 [Claviceps purpurea]